MKSNLFIVIFLTIAFANCASKVQSTAKTEKMPNLDELDPKMIEGKNLYEMSCGKCHRLYNPSEYTAENWKPIVDRMQKKARLDNDQITLVYQYLSANSKK